MRWDTSKGIKVTSKVNPRSAQTRFMIAIAILSKIKPKALAALMVGDKTRKYTEELSNELDKLVSSVIE